MKQLCTTLFFFLVWWQVALSQEVPYDTNHPHVLHSAEMKEMMTRPVRLEGWWTNQTGPLSRRDLAEDAPPVSTFTVESLRIPSEGDTLQGWLYLPFGTEPCPLIVLTNGGGGGTRPIKSFSDFLAPILAHCGYAALVHDKRGTGASTGEFRNTTYDDYITDAGNCALYLKDHPRIDTARIGVCGASEGGRIAVIAASRFPVFSFVISYAGTVVSAVDDRINAQKGWLQSLGLSDSVYEVVLALHERAIRAWASDDPAKLDSVDREIVEMRKIYGNDYLPWTKAEMDSIPFFDDILPTWNSLKEDYMSEMTGFRKKWFAIFGAEDVVVPTNASVKNILRDMALSGNPDYTVAVIPDCGHTPVSSVTGRMVRFDHMIVHWLDEHVARTPESSIVNAIAKVWISDRCLQLRFGSDAVTVLSTPKGLVVVDAGISSTMGWRYRHLIEAEFPGKEFLYLITTHGHHDHVGGSRAFDDAVRIAQKNSSDEINDQWAKPEALCRALEKIVKQYQRDEDSSVYRSKEWEEAWQQEIRYRSEWEDALKNYPPPLPDTVFEDSLSLAIGRDTVEMVWYGPAHSQSDILIFFPKERLLFSGDLFSRYGIPGWDARGEEPNPQRLRATQWLLHRAPHIDKVITGHGQLLTRDDLMEFCKP